MKLLSIVLVGGCLFTTSCGIMDCQRPAESMSLSVVGPATASYSLTGVKNNPVRMQKLPDGTFRLDIPSQRYGGMMIVFIPYVKDPEREWKVNVIRENELVLLTTIAKIRKLKEIDGTRILTVEKN